MVHFVSLKSSMKVKFENFQKYTISVSLDEGRLQFKLRTSSESFRTNDYQLTESFKSLSTFPASQNNEQLLCTFIQEQFKTLNPRQVEVVDVMPSGKKVVIGVSYGLMGGVTSNQILKLTFSGVQMVAAVAVGTLNPVAGAVLMSSATGTAIKVLQDKNCSTRDYFKTALINGTATLAGGGPAALVGEGYKAIILAGALSRPTAKVMEAVVDNKKLPSGKELIGEVVVGGITNVVGNKTSEWTSKASQLVLSKLINPASSALKAVVNQSLTAATAATSSQVTSTLTENIILQQPLGKNLEPATLVATALASGAAGGIHAYMNHQDKRVKLTVQDDDGNERVLWSGSEQDYEDYDIAEKVKEWQEVMDLDQLTERLAEITGEKSSGKRKADDDGDEISRVKRARVEPLVPFEKWDDSLTAEKLVKTERHAGGGIQAIAQRMADTLACKFWGGDPAYHDSAAKEAMRVQFEKDQEGSSKRHEKRLIRSATRYMESNRAEPAAKALLAQYESQKPVTVQTVKYLNSVPQANLIVQVFIEKIDKEFKKAGYSPLNGQQKTELTMICNQHLETTATDRQRDSFINACFATAGGNFPPKDIAKGREIFALAQETAVKIGRRQFGGLDEVKQERVHKNRTKVLKSVVRVGEQAVKEVFKGGVGVGVQTNGQDVKATVGTAKQPDAIPVYNSGEKGQFSKQLDEAVNKPAPAREQPVSMDIEETVLLQKSALPATLPLSLKRPALPEKAKNTPPQKKVAKEKTSASSSKAERTKLTIPTKEKQKEKDKKDNTRWRDPKTGRYTTAPQKQIPTGGIGFFNKPGLSIRDADRTAAVSNSVSFVEPVKLSENIQVELTKSTSVSAVQVTTESGIPSVSVAASTRLEVLKTEGGSRVDLFTGDVTGNVSSEGFSVGARVSAAKGQTFFRSKPSCNQDTCTTVTVVGELSLLSAGGEVGFSNKENKTSVKLGVGVGPIGASTQVIVEKSKNYTNGSVEGPEMSDMIVKTRMK
ncbi:hypothetical protein B1207_12080 [Legionella quinlivanii]|uniref:Uncharacterized protein n=2 Tax=Legionella quinlivanii TaxID=45073 RepID=A0A364LGS3_9GAMM|nr:hypothetical protein B1207_12080 [Legionella quinlivanii]